VGDESGEPAAGAGSEGQPRDLHQRLSELEARLTGDVRKGVESTVGPAWSRITKGEIRWPVTAAIVAALAMQYSLPDNLVFGPRWLLPSVGGALTVALVAANPHRIDRASKALRALGLVLIATISIANAGSAIRLIDRLVTVGEADAVHLLRTGSAIWLTNVIIFALWYWERMYGTAEYPDFQFPQMESQHAPPDWEPYFVDYFYFSFTNASAFSPTDVMPFSRWAKLAMLLQSAVSLVTVALVIARAVNILK
jgi:uncharacterized membrane protein